MQSLESPRGGPAPRGGLEHGPAGDRDPAGGHRIAAWLWAAAAVALLARVPALPGRVFDPDEFEHAHAAWCLSRGMVLYRDFFEHHTPWYYYVLRPLFNWFAVDQSFQSGTSFLLAGRLLSLTLTAVTLVLVARVGAALPGGKWESRIVGPLAALLLVSQPVVLQKTIELRPDVLALPLSVATLLLLLRGLIPQAQPRRLALFLAAGLCQGGAIMCTQKMLFVLPGLAVGVGLWALRGDGGAPATRGLAGRLLAGVAFMLGLVVPALATWAALSAQGAGAQFISNNFLMNARWHHLPTNQFRKLLIHSGPMFALTLVAVGALLVRAVRLRARDHGEILLAASMASVLLGALVIPVAQRQYYLMMMPAASVLAARGLEVLAARLAGSQRLAPSTRRVLGAAAIVGLALTPAIALVNTYRERNDSQLALLKQVYARTAPTDLVMDGWRGMGVFRPHAYHHYFLHEEAVAMLDPTDFASYLDALERGTIIPKLIVMDKNLASLSPRFHSFLHRHYTTTDQILYFRH